MKCIKRSLAAAMAVLLMVPSQMVWAAPMPEGQVNDGTSAEKKKSESSLVKTATASSADEEVHNGWKEITATPSSASWKPKEEIRFNTGNAEVSVVSREDFLNMIWVMCTLKGWKLHHPDSGRQSVLPL